jgi:hypothetical protein
VGRGEIMDIWVNPKVENKLRKEGWTIPIRPKNGRIFYKEEDVGFSDDFIGLRIEDDKQEALRFLVDNEDRLGLCLWNIPKIERMW